MAKSGQVTNKLSIKIANTKKVCISASPIAVPNAWWELRRNKNISGHWVLRVLCGINIYIMDIIYDIYYI